MKKVVTSDENLKTLCRQLVKVEIILLLPTPPSKESFYQEVSKDPTVQILASWEGNPATPTP
jgi:hypothetical protein